MTAPPLVKTGDDQFQGDRVRRMPVRYRSGWPHSCCGSCINRKSSNRRQFHYRSFLITLHNFKRLT